MNHSISVLDFLISSERYNIPLYMECVAGRRGLFKPLTNALNRPGLALNGIFSNFGESRAHLFGRGEVEFLYELEKKGALEGILKQFFSHKVSCCIVSHIEEQKPPELLAQFCEEHDCPLLYSSLQTYELSIRIYRVFNRCFAPTMLMHGVFMDIRDLGVLLTGKSGIGKSENALGILERGFSRIIVDDAVLLERVDESTILGSSPDASRYKHHLEIRGIGFINLSQMFGINIMLKSKTLNMVVHLEEWGDKNEAELDRLEQEHFTEILGVQVPFVTVPVKVGRNIPLLIETAVLKHRLKLLGYHGKEDPFLW